MKLSLRKIVLIGLSLLVLAGIPITVFLVRRYQTLKSSAAEYENLLICSPEQTFTSLRNALCRMFPNPEAPRISVSGGVVTVEGSFCFDDEFEVLFSQLNNSRTKIHVAHNLRTEEIPPNDMGKLGVLYTADERSVGVPDETKPICQYSVGPRFKNQGNWLNVEFSFNATVFNSSAFRQKIDALQIGDCASLYLHFLSSTEVNQYNLYTFSKEQYSDELKPYLCKQAPPPRTVCDSEFKCVTTTDPLDSRTPCTTTSPGTVNDDCYQVVCQNYDRSETNTCGRRASVSETNVRSCSSDSDCQLTPPITTVCDSEYRCVTTTDPQDPRLSCTTTSAGTKDDECFKTVCAQNTKSSTNTCTREVAQNDPNTSYIPCTSNPDCQPGTQIYFACVYENGANIGSCMRKTGTGPGEGEESCLDPLGTECGANPGLCANQCKKPDDDTPQGTPFSAIAMTTTLLIVLGISLRFIFR